MDIIVEDLNGTRHTIQSVNVSPTINIPPNYLTHGAIDIFKVQHRVPDVWRYIVNVNNTSIMITPSTGNFIVDETNIIQSDDTPIILLILESPHKHEYCYKNGNRLLPKTPAQGNTGRHIEQYLDDVISQISPPPPNGRYQLIISNPIPYMCSLGVFNSALNSTTRNAVWLAIWNYRVGGSLIFQDEFIARCQRYKPRYIINCCTRNLKKNVRILLCNNLSTINPTLNLYEANHPSVQWGKQNFGIKKVI